MVPGDLQKWSWAFSVEMLLNDMNNISSGVSKTALGATHSNPFLWSVTGLKGKLPLLKVQRWIFFFSPQKYLWTFLLTFFCTALKFHFTYLKGNLWLSNQNRKIKACLAFNFISKHSIRQ